MGETGILDKEKIHKIHFIGIGGISMSGLAQILKNMGYSISGSDLNISAITKKLNNLGIPTFEGHSQNNIKEDIDLIVYNAAIKQDNVEIIRAKELNIPSIERSVLLGELMKKYNYSIAVSGTHGKTTTTSMISLTMLECKLDPTIHIGGELDYIGGNTRVGGNKYFITEACEYFESFLKFNPYIAVVLNIEADHLDYFKNIEHIKKAFLEFVSLVPKEGYAVLCIDDKNVYSLIEKISCNVVTYSVLNLQANFSAKDIVFNDLGCASYTLLENGKEISNIKLNVPGIHNVSNSLASIACCISAGLTIEKISNALPLFNGTKRRFQLKGEVNKIKVYDDYAHHPTEIKATLSAAKKMNNSRIIAIFQPHTYTRTKALLKEFSEAFIGVDCLILSDIYAAREQDKGEVHSKMLKSEIETKMKDVYYFGSFNSIVKFLKENTRNGDLIITMGAGDIYKVGESFLKEF